MRSYLVVTFFVLGSFVPIISVAQEADVELDQNIILAKSGDEIFKEILRGILKESTDDETSSTEDDSQPDEQETEVPSEWEHYESDTRSYFDHCGGDLFARGPVLPNDSRIRAYEIGLTSDETVIAYWDDRHATNARNLVYELQNMFDDADIYNEYLDEESQQYRYYIHVRSAEKGHESLILHDTKFCEMVYIANDIGCVVAAVALRPPLKRTPGQNELERCGLSHFDFF